MSIVFVIILIIFMLLIFEIKRELMTFQVNHYITAYKKLNSLPEEKKVIFISDLHNQVYGKDNEDLLAHINKEKPEMILVGGDMLIGTKDVPFDAALNFVKHLPEIAPTYYANGNHEQRIKEKPQKYGLDFQKYKKELLQYGVHFLENTTEKVMWDEIPVYITGLEIPLENYKHFEVPKLEYKEIEKRIGRKALEGFNILLAHSPSYMNLYKEWGADLVLSGHYHGGLVRIPGSIGLIIPGFLKNWKYSGGIYKEGDVRLIVSKGIGNHTIKLRLFNKAEVICLHIKGDKLVKKSKI